MQLVRNTPSKTKKVNKMFKSKAYNEKMLEKKRAESEVDLKEKKTIKLAYVAIALFVVMFFIDNFLLRMATLGVVFSLLAVFFYMGVFVVGVGRGKIADINNTSVDKEVIVELKEKYGDDFTTAFLYSEGRYGHLKKLDEKFLKFQQMKDVVKES